MTYWLNPKSIIDTNRVAKRAKKWLDINRVNITTKTYSTEIPINKMFVLKMQPNLNFGCVCTLHTYKVIKTKPNNSFQKSLLRSVISIEIIHWIIRNIFIQKENFVINWGQIIEVTNPRHRHEERKVVIAFLIQNLSSIYSPIHWSLQSFQDSDISQQTFFIRVKHTKILSGRMDLFEMTIILLYNIYIEVWERWEM